MTTWHEFVAKARPSIDWRAVGPVLTLDPGETTGWATWNNGDFLDCGQEPTPSPVDMAYFIRDMLPPDLGDLERFTIVYEEYRVRGNKFKEHVGSEVVTIQHIGVIKAVADENGVRVWKQTAGQVKGFATDAKLRRWSLYQSGLRHANDAIRHGVYYHLFIAGRANWRQIGHGSNEGNDTG